MHTKRLVVLGARGIPGRYGGFETFAEELSVLLTGRGVDVTVFCENAESTRPKFYKKVRLMYVDAPPLGPVARVLLDLIALWRARKNYDVVYVLGYGASLFCFIPRLWGTQVWINMDGVEWARTKWNWFGRTWLKLMEAFAMRTPNRIIADAEGIRQHLIRRHSRVPDCSVIPYGAPILETIPPQTLLSTWNLESGKYYVVVCRLEPENHVLEIIQGYVRSNSSLPLVVVGDKESGSRYLESLKQAADSRVQFIGTIFDVPVLQCLRFHCVAYFHGHSVGGTNPSLLEAMGCGNLVVAHDNVYNREVLGEHGRFFSKSADIPTMMDAIESLTHANRIGESESVRDRCRKQYSWEKIVDAYCDLLEQIPSRNSQ